MLIFILKHFYLSELKNIVKCSNVLNILHYSYQFSANYVTEQNSLLSSHISFLKIS